MTNKLYFNSKSRKEEQSAFATIKKEQSSIGYYALPDQDLTSILEYCSSISEDVETIAVIGIGGEFTRSKSSL